MSRSSGSGQASVALQTFAVGLASLGILALITGDFALQWQPVPAALHNRALVARATGALELLLGAGLFTSRFRESVKWLLLAFSLVWVIALKIPVVVAAPLVEASWLGLGEIAMILAAALSLMNAPVMRRAGRILFGVALIPVGLSHIVYAKVTAGFIPAWIPHKLEWAYFTGAAHIAAGLAVLADVLAVLGATLEGVMIGGFTVLVWLPAVVAKPSAQLPWTAFLISWTIAAAAWVVATRLE